MEDLVALGAELDVLENHLDTAGVSTYVFSFKLIT